MRTSNYRVAKALHLFTGEADLRFFYAHEPFRTPEAVRGRTCLNCDRKPLKFLIIPGHDKISLLCWDCAVGLVQDDPHPGDFVAPADVASAVAELHAILADTGG